LNGIVEDDEIVLLGFSSKKKNTKKIEEDRRWLVLAGCEMEMVLKMNMVMKNG
jgi:hypothetical protein